MECASSDLVLRARDCNSTPSSIGFRSRHPHSQPECSLTEVTVRDEGLSIVSSRVHMTYHYHLCKRILTHRRRRWSYVSLLTALSTPETANEAARHPKSKQRRRFSYILPLVGPVRGKAFIAAYDVSESTLTRYRGQLNAEAVILPNHTSKRSQKRPRKSFSLDEGKEAVV